MVKTRHSLSCLENPIGPEGQSILKLRLVLFFVGCENYVEILRRALPIAPDIIGTISANLNGERKVRL